MSNINYVVVEGNLTKAAELSHWADGTPYCRFTIATNESYKDKDGNWVDIASFIDCMCRGGYAESMHKHLLKGRHLTVSGRLKQNRWKDEGGNTKSAIFVKVDNISLAPGNFHAKQEQAGGAPQFKPAAAADYDQAADDWQQPADENYTDSDIPF